MERFHQALAPAYPQNQIVVGCTRLSLLSAKILRIEYSKTKDFIDHRTQTVFCRDFAKPKADFVQKGNRVTIHCENRTYVVDVVSLSYRVYIDNVEVKVSHRQNLKGTLRTLDGNTGVGTKLPDGLMSKSGLTVLDDSATCLLNEDGSIFPRAKGGKDFYLLAFGHDYLGGLQEFYKLSGAVPVIPKYALGNWWSRYHAYTDKEYLDLMDEFAKRTIPFTVATVDMDWHLVKNVPKDVPYDVRFGRGWTGYTFDSTLFPDYKAFLQALHDRNLKTALNLHPKDGVRYFEVQYPEMAKANGIDAATKQPVEFDLLDKTFRDSYFDILHHPYEKDGVDLWWIDWQQGTKSKMQGVDPLWLLNHYHYLDINREKQGIILSRFAGIGSHRYPLGFSGDTFVLWSSLKLQPYFTATAANVGYSWWSHDIGGHMENRGDNELYLRWLQLGCFSPINRLHSTNTTKSKEPWLYPKVTKEAIAFLQLRHSLIAYCYSASLLNHANGVPICAPLYYFYDEPNAYKKKFRNEYIFASHLLVCPIVKPKGKRKDSVLTVWFPKGEWVNIFTGKTYSGSTVQKITCPLSEYPVFAKKGSFLPLLQTEGNTISQKRLLVKTFLGKGQYELLDDSGSLVFTCQAEENGYTIDVQTVGHTQTEWLEFEFVGTTLSNQTIALEKNAHFFVEYKL